ncbi:MAG: potassium/proton antiporter [Lentisphaeria bacterium]|nr:potassium/proton antiporter [Lentisphaeria bacterium]
MELYIILALLGVLMLLSLLSSKLSSRINMPCLLLFLAVGMLWGSDTVTSFITATPLIPDAQSAQMTKGVSPVLANYIGSIALAFILFSGGFDTDWKSVKKVFRTGALLSTLGVLLSAVITGFATYGLVSYAAPSLNFSLSWCLLLGAIISSTDAAAVFSILRSKSVSLKGQLQPLLEFESGSNDPMAAFLTLFFLSLVTMETNRGLSPAVLDYLLVLPTFFRDMTIGILMGVGIGALFVWIYNKIDFDYNGLYYVLAVVVVLLTYSVTSLCYGNGFMAVYAAGICMGNSKFVFHNGVGRFYDGLAWMMQVILFTMLGRLAAPGAVWEAKWFGFAIAGFLMVIARPLAVFLCMWKSPFSFRERLLVSWVGLRGGAPIMLATFPLLAMPDALGTKALFYIVFFIVITSVLLQGMTIMPLAKLLKLDAPLKKKVRMPLSFEETGDSSSDSIELEVPASRNGQTLAELKLPEGALILMIRRDEKFIVPRGDTSLQEGDVLTIMGIPSAVNSCEDFLQQVPEGTVK